MFGLTLQSEIELPSLHCVDGPGPGSTGTEICILAQGIPRASAVSSRQVGAYAKAAPEQVSVTVPGLGQFLIRDGRRIDVEPEPDYDAQTMELYLLGNMLGTLLLQRRFLVMHGNVLEKNGSAVLLCGNSSAGKSTLSAALIQNSGFRLVSDDLAVFDQQGKLREGPAEIKLWRDAIDALELPLHSMQPLNAQVEKYRWAQKSDDMPVGLLKLTAVYIFGSDNRAQATEFEELAGMDKLLPLRHQVYRSNFVEPMGLAQHHFLTISRLFGTLPVLRLNRALEGFRRSALQSLAGAVSKDVATRVGAP